MRAPQDDQHAEQEALHGPERRQELEEVHGLEYSRLPGVPEASADNSVTFLVKIRRRDRSALTNDT